MDSAPPAEITGHPCHLPSVWTLPSQTMGRFLVLVAAVLGTAASTYQRMLINGDSLRESLACVLKYPTTGLSARAYSAAIEAQSRCRRPFDQQWSRDMLLGIGLTLGATLLVYWLLPLWDRYVRRLRPLDPNVHGEILTELASLTAQAGLARRPIFLYSLSPRVNANTFGWFPRYFVRIDGGLLTTFTTDRRAFSALVRHELAHLRFRDVDVTRLTVALSLAFPLVVLLPYAVMTLKAESWLSIGSDSLQVAALSVLVFLSSASVLRARELAADAWAVRGGADEVADLNRVLARQEQSTGLWRRLGELFGAHPSASRRVAELARPRALFRTGFWEAFAVGTAAGVAAVPILDLFTSWYYGPFSRSAAAAVTTMLIISLFTAGVIGPAMWRATLTSLATGRRPPHGVLPGLGLGVGILVGERGVWQGQAVAMDSTYPVVQVVFAVLIVLSQILYCRWVTTGAAAWLPTIRRETARVTFFAGFPLQVVVAAVPLAVHLEFSYLGYESTFRILTERYVLVAKGAWSVLGQLILLVEGIQQTITTTYPSVITGVFLVCLLYPLAAWFRAGTELFDPRKPLAAGLAGGVVYVAVAPFLWVEYSASLTDVRIPNALFPLLDQLQLTLPAALIQAVVAAVVAASARRMPALQGLMAALVTSVVQISVFLLVGSTDLCWEGSQSGHCAEWIGWSDAELLTVPFFTTAPLLALVTSMGASGITRLGRVSPVSADIRTSSAFTAPRPAAQLAVISGIVIAILLPSGLWIGSQLEDRRTPTVAQGNCLVGTWTLQSARYEVSTEPPGPKSSEVVTVRGPVGGSSGKQVVYRADGTATSNYDFRGQGFTADGKTMTLSIQGRTDQKWQAPFSSVVASGVMTTAYRVEVRIGGKLAWSAAPPDGPSPEVSTGQYTCDEHQLEILTARGAIEQYTR
ncbi:M48 family metalloprotease [Sphaerisporangium viridialbum]|uniref:M48 family metalloprotease n=1 Tax=Sphaerisporangium viridialbum TaxID=46189 RepID=UPI003C76CA84